MSEKGATFAGVMQRKEWWTNLLLVLLVVALATICVWSVVREVQTDNQKEELRDGRNQ